MGRRERDGEGNKEGQKNKKFREGLEKGENEKKVIKKGGGGEKSREVPRVFVESQVCGRS